MICRCQYWLKYVFVLMICEYEISSIVVQMHKSLFEKKFYSLAMMVCWIVFHSYMLNHHYLVDKKIFKIDIREMIYLLFISCVVGWRSWVIGICFSSVFSSSCFVLIADECSTSVWLILTACNWSSAIRELSATIKVHRCELLGGMNHRCGWFKCWSCCFRR